MGKKLKTDSQMIFRLILFLTLTGLGFWWLFKKTSTKYGNHPDFDKVKGEKASIIENIERFLPEPVVKTGEKIVDLIPEESKNQFRKIFEEQIIRQSTQIIQDTLVKEEIRETLKEATDQITGFPEKQKKEVQREVIKQVCEDLLEEVK